jgi:large subunit ribosomal protein L24
MYTPPKKKGPRNTKPEFAGKMRLRVGDTVRVISGRDKGKEGVISRVLPAVGKVVIEGGSEKGSEGYVGINIVIKHQKPRPSANQNAAIQQQQSGRIEIAAPILACKVQLVDKGKGDAVTRVGIRTDASGNRVRYAKKSGGVIENA